MNPDVASADYQRAQEMRRAAAEREVSRLAELHARAVERRRKRKRGGKR